MNIELITTEELRKVLQEHLEAVSKIIVHTNEELPEWLNDEQCWKLKGGMALNTYRSNRYYQCKGGIPDGYVGGRKVWNKETVMEWLPLTDDQLPEYHNKYKTGAKKK